MRRGVPRALQEGGAQTDPNAHPDRIRTMAKMRKKSDLPQKVCAACGRPFAWRKKWAAVWDQVRYCSDACRRKRG